jgi:predicted nucleic acid-binding Zn ribbon protein
MHCLWCRRVTAEGKTFCSRKCKEEYEQWQRKKRQINILYIAIGIAGIILVLIISNVFG